ncbi:MAG TPA: proline dehydrogenase family protein [Actinomycetales bacterium]|nr:proline dehydrogenase family protein [Actinomycetales bacterium]
MLNNALRTVLLQMAKSHRLRDVLEGAPVSRQVVRRFVAGAEVADAVTTAADLVAEGLSVTIDHLGEDTMDRAQASATTGAYLKLIEQLSDAGLTEGGRAEVSVKLSAVGQALGADGPSLATENARVICEAAERAGTTVTLDMEDHTTTDLTLQTLRDLRTDFPWVGAVLQSYLRRTEGDCRDLAGVGSRVRLCKGAYAEPESVAFQGKAEVDRSYVRCLKVLMAGQGYPMVASHDPRLIDIAGALAVKYGRAPGTYEYQMLFGIRPDEQKRLVRVGEVVRVYLPYGQEWYGYLMRRMAERPANTAFFLRALATRG